MTSEDAGIRPGDLELSIHEMIVFAMGLHSDGRLDAAEKCYRAVVQLEPENANALHYLGVLLRQRSKTIDGLELVRRSITIDASVAAWHNNLGNMLLDDGRY